MKPTGTVTFLFTDIEGSTRLAQEFPKTLQVAIDLHHSILSKAIESNGGFIFEIVGDAFCSAFQNAEDAVKAAVDAQIGLAKADWNDVVIKARMGIHSGSAEWNGSRYMGYITLARSARVMSCGSGDQIIISESTYELVKYKLGAVPDKKVSFRDLGERRLKDVILPIRLFQVIHPELRDNFPPLKTLDARPNNLPVQLTSFIGREKEILHIKDILKNTRLLTLTGPGGSGKTRLSLQIAAEIIDDFENGVWVSELAPLSEPELLPQTIMNVFGLKEESGKGPEELLCGYLKDKELLIILDNCEHLIDACAELTETLLVRCPRLKIIGTSREALRCHGEVTHSISTLNTPDPGKNLSAENLSSYESVRLFIERALAVNKNFRVNNDNAPALAQICHQLDGIPLAIELAAVRIKVLPLEKICEKLDDRFRLLTGGRRTSLPRQQTLKALIDWSYDLLNEEEKILWSRLSVFSGGWTLSDAEEVCSGDPIHKDDILELTHGLVEKSLMIFSDITGRYKMLETIKQYGAVKLTESGEADRFKTSHLNYYLKLCEGAVPELNGPKARNWMERFEQEYPNIQSAMELSLEKDLNVEGHKLAATLTKLWDVRGYLSEARSWLERLLQKTEGVPLLILAQTKRNAGMFATQQGNNTIAAQYLEESLSVYREANDINGISICLNTVGLIEYDLGNYKKAEEILNENLKIKRELGNKVGISSALNSCGLVELVQGKNSEAEKLFYESYNIALEVGNDEYIGIGLNNLGQIYAMKGDYDRSRIYFEEGLKRDREMGNKYGIGISLVNLGSLAMQFNDLENAKIYFNESLAISTEIGSILCLVYALSGLGQASLAERDLEKSYYYFNECLNRQKESIDLKTLALGLTGIAEINLLRDKPETALILLGALEAKYEALNAYVEDETRSKIDEIFKKVSDKIGNEKAKEEFKKGKKLSADDAISMVNGESSIVNGES